MVFLILKNIRAANVVLKCLMILVFVGSAPAKAEDSTSFHFYDRASTKAVGFNECPNPLVLNNMPPIRSQGTLSVCYAMSSAVIAQFHYCKTHPSHCLNGAPKSAEYSISPLGTLNWTRTRRGTNEGNSSSYGSLQFNAKGGGASDALRHAQALGNHYISDACYPFEQVANRKIDKSDPFESIAQAASIIESHYLKARTDAGFCEECLKKAGDVFKGADSLVSIKKQMELSKSANRTAGEFMYDLLVNECQKIVEYSEDDDFPNFAMYPRKGQNPSYHDLVDKIKSVLGGTKGDAKDGNPLAFDGVCALYKGDKCVAEHSVAISGYKKICKASNECNQSRVSKSCDEYLRVQNSWGADWNAQGEGGWVKASELLKYVLRDRAKMPNTLSWYY